jgi:hypothetical protein
MQDPNKSQKKGVRKNSFQTPRGGNNTSVHGWLTVFTIGFIFHNNRGRTVCRFPEKNN